MKFPIVKNVNAKSVFDELERVTPSEKRYNEIFKIMQSTQPMVYERNYIVDESNIESTKIDFGTEDVQIGDEVKAFDWGGWNALAGRAGEQLLRDGKVINGRYTRIS
jgi:hypothetical protein